MRNDCLTALLIILFSGNIYSQISQRDSLLLEISTEKNDTNRIRLLVQLGMNYAENDSMASVYLKEAYDLSLGRNYRYGRAFGQYYEVLELSQDGRYDQAIDKCKQCIESIDSLNLKVGVSVDEHSFTFQFSGQAGGKVPVLFRKSLTYYKSHGPIENTAICFHGIAGYYYSPCRL